MKNKTITVWSPHPLPWKANQMPKGPITNTLSRLMTVLEKRFHKYSFKNRYAEAFEITD